MSDLYHGSSDSFEFVTQCYFDYANEVICRRALPDLRDGQKKVSRRIIYSAYMNKKPTMQKCIPFVSDAIKLHPHGDSAVYGSFTLMTDENGSCNMPMFEALGNLGKVWSTKTPADMRYPKAKVGKNMEDFFKDKEVMHLEPAEEGEGMEPKVLNAIYPIVLVNGTMGIAVSVGTKIPSFNFGDVVDLTIKYLENGKLEVTDVIVPDFPTGGVLVRNDEELAKIMATGKGKLKIRAKVEVVGNQILVKEVPYGKTVEGIVNLIKKAGIREISSVSNTVGRNSPAFVTIDCRSKKVVDYVLKELYRRNILQNIYASNIVVTEDEVPYILGVHNIIKRWCAWRVSVLNEKFNKALADIAGEVTTLDYFTRLISNPEWKDTYVAKATHEGKTSANGYLHEIFEDIPEDVCEWIRGRAISAFHNGGRYTKRLEELLESKDFYERSLKYPEEYIINELKELKESKAGEYDRKTQVTYTDYKFSKIAESDEIEDESFCVWTLMESGFLRKTRDWYGTESEKDKVLCQFEGQANSILIGFDNFGRVLRVPGKEIEYTESGDSGVYLPRYFEANFQEDYRVLYMGLLDGKTRTLLYRDGYIGFFDTAEYYGKKLIKVVSKGVSLAVGDKLLQVYEDGELPQMIAVADDDPDGVWKFGVIITEGIIHKSRLSRTKVLDGNVNYKYIRGFNGMEIYSFMEHPEKYMGKMRKLNSEIYGDSDMEEGRYLELCKDIEIEE